MHTSDISHDGYQTTKWWNKADGNAQVSDNDTCRHSQHKTIDALGETMNADSEACAMQLHVIRCDTAYQRSK